MDIAVAFFVAIVINAVILLYLQKKYDPDLYRFVALTYLGTITFRYLLAIYLWFNHTDSSFSIMFWGDSHTYDSLGAVVADGWSQGASFSSWRLTLEGRVNTGFIYFVAVVYYIFGHNALLVQFLNGIIGALTSIVILELGLLLYDRRVAARAMLFTAFFPQMLFWSSAMYKDPAVMFCIALSMLSVIQLKQRFRLSSVLIYVATVTALIWLRFYIFYAIVAATLASFLVGHRRGLLFGLVTQVFLVVGVVVALLFTPAGQEMLDQARFLDFQQLQNTRDDLATRAGSGFGNDTDVSTFSGILSFLPKGIAYLLFAPFPWMVGSLRQALAMPDVLLWYAMVPALARGLVHAIKHRLAQTMPILVFTTALTLAYGAFLGNVGTAYRQRTQIMMFYFLFVADGLDRGKRRAEETLTPSEVGNEAVSP